MRRIKKSTLIPPILLAYLAVMSVFGFRSMQDGLITPLYYGLVIAGSLACIAGAYLLMRRREKMQEKDNQDNK